MGGSARAAKITTERIVPPSARPAPRPRRPVETPPAIDVAQLQRAVGNLGIQHLLSLGVLRGQAGVRAARPASGKHAARVSDRSGLPSPSAVSSRAPGVPASVPLSQRIAESVSRVGVQKGGGETAPPSPVTPDVPVDIAPPATVRTPESDAGYQGVVKKLGTNASRQKTPVKEPDAKVGEISVAAELPPARRNEEKAYAQQMDDLAAAPIPKIEDFTVENFMEAFRHGFEELAKQLPNASKDNHAVSNAVNFGSEKAIAVKELKSQSDTKSEALRTAASRNPQEIAKRSDSPPPAPELTADPAGPVPAIPNASAAAPKPVPSKDISLEDQSKALDDALKNQVAGGQVVNISEDSLPFPVSGEKSFAEAGEEKRKAQEMIRRIIPSYRGVETPALAKARTSVNHVVNTGLEDYHGKRQESFGGVLDVQQRNEHVVEGQKDAVVGQFAITYAQTKILVDLELLTLNGVGEEFEGILTKAESDLKSWVRNNLEYIYTPGMFDYSDWIDKRKPDVLKEYERLERADIGPSGALRYLRALKTIQDKDAQILFDDAKRLFLENVTFQARSIAVKVVEALNRANQHIRDGQARATEIYNGLSTKEKAQYANAYTAVMGQYTTLAETVADRHREIVGDMARSYNKVAGTLQATFEAIRKDVLTSWWQKAWNKIKAVVNAIIEFAKRIAELLGEMLSLVGEIISSPRYFFNNLVTGIGRGLSTFAEHIDQFLADAFFDWLRGSTGVSVQLPKDWDAKGIFSLFTQLLNLSTETIWQRMEVVYDKTVADAFRRGEVLFEKGLELFAIIKNEGLGGLWTHIKESLGTILKEALESMKETILYAAIKKVMLEVGKLLIPGGGFIAIAEKIIRLVVFIVEARNKILDLIESFVNSMALAVKGDVSGIVSKVTGALKSFIVVALDFLVSFFGLGGLKSKIERVIDRMRSPIIRGIDWVLGKLKPVVMRVMGAVQRGKEAVVGAGKRIAMAGVPEDPAERLRLGAQAAVAAARRLSGQVTKALLQPVLYGVQLRYGLQEVKPYERDDTWWVHIAVNPEKEQDTGVSSKDEAPATELTGGEILSRIVRAVRRSGVTVGSGDLPKVLERLRKHFEPLGLRSLQLVRAPGKAPSIAISTTSTEEMERYRATLNLSLPDYGSVIALLSIDGKTRTHLWNGRGKHAEGKVIDLVRETISRLHEVPRTVEILVSQSPCRHKCKPELNDLRREYPNTRFSLYYETLHQSTSGKQTEESQEALREMASRRGGWHVAIWTAKDGMIQSPELEWLR